jgi:hypothetical protein
MFLLIEADTGRVAQAMPAREQGSLFWHTGCSPESYAKEKCVASSEERMARLVESLLQAPGLAESLPSEEGEIVRDALAGQSVYQIAQQHRVTERRVWDIVGNAARAASGQELHQVETGGFGSDTDPGITGGYGDTGMGSLGNEPPVPSSEEPEQP